MVVRLTMARMRAEARSSSNCRFAADMALVWPKPLMAGRLIAARMPMMEMTTSNSSSVKASSFRPPVRALLKKAPALETQAEWSFSVELPQLFKQFCTVPLLRVPTENIVFVSRLVGYPSDGYCTIRPEGPNHYTLSGLINISIYSSIFDQPDSLPFFYITIKPVPAFVVVIHIDRDDVGIAPRIAEHAVFSDTRRNRIANHFSV